MPDEADYRLMTDEEFDTILRELVNEMTVAQILSYGDVYSILREELNNEVLTLWGQQNPEKAFTRTIPKAMAARGKFVHDRGCVLFAACPWGYKVQVFKRCEDQPSETYTSGNYHHESTVVVEPGTAGCISLAELWCNAKKTAREMAEERKIPVSNVGPDEDMVDGLWDEHETVTQKGAVS